MSKKTITNLFLLITFILINFALFALTEINKDQRINTSLENHLNSLETHYKVQLKQMKLIADGAYRTITHFDGTKDILSIASTTKDKKELNKLRIKLYEKLKYKYDVMRSKGIYQVHFILPDNTSFLRLHKPNKFGDNLTKIRKDITYINKIKKPIVELAVGKTTSGFRNIFPIFNNNDKYIGSIDISFQSSFLQNELTEISNLHTHLLIKSDLFKNKIWDIKGNNLKYYQSAENKDFILNMTQQHSKESCVIERKKRLKPLQNDIKNKMQKGDKFSIYSQEENDIVRVISFYPITSNRTNKINGWLVSYEKDEFVAFTLKGLIIVRLSFFVLFLLIFYFMYKTIYQKELLDEEVHKKTKELKELNESLEKRIKEEVDKNKQNELQLFEQSKMAAMGDMIGNIAHQWRQPLSLITTAASGLQLKKEYGILDDDFFDKTLLEIENSAHYLSKTIDTFRNFIKEKKEFKEVILQERIHKALEIVETTCRNNHIKLINNTHGVEEIKINLVTGELSQVIINIINNAKDILNEKNIDEAWIKVNLEKTNDKAIISIEDNGGGIPDDIINKVFEPYFTTKHETQGTGLGLHMSYKIIVESLKGRIYVQNTKNGAKFYIELPLS